jgi:vacuolar-type H+-ATPase subunit E/Vma4
MADDPKGLAMMTKGQDAMFDYEFFLILSDMQARAEAMGDEKALRQLTTLRERLMETTSYGKRIAKQQAAVESLKELKSPEEFLEKVVAAEPEVVDAIAVSARPLMDYTFFQKLTERTESARGAEKDRLTKLRDHLADLTQKLDEATRATIQDATGLLQELLSSEDPRAAVREHADELDNTFMAVLSANLQEAQRRGRKATFERLTKIYDEIMAIVEEGMPPEVQLVNELLRAPYPDGTRALLKERQSKLTPEVVELIGQMGDDLARRAEESRSEEEKRDLAETAKRLQDIKSQAMLLV